MNKKQSNRQADDDHRLEEELADFNASWEERYDSPELAVSRLSDTQCRAILDDPEATVEVGGIAFPVCYSVEEMEEYADMLWGANRFDECQSPIELMLAVFGKYGERVPVACQCTAAHLKATMYKECGSDLESMREACRDDVLRSVANISRRLGYAIKERVGR